MDDLKVTNISTQKKIKGSKKNKTTQKNDIASTSKIEDRLTNKILSLSDKKILETMEADGFVGKASTSSTPPEVSLTCGNSMQWIITDELQCLITDADACAAALISTQDKFHALNKVFIFYLSLN